MTTLTTSLTGIRAPESCDGNPVLPGFALQRILSDWFFSRAGLQIDNSAWVWQLRGQTDTQTSCVSFFPAALQLSAFSPELPINSQLIKNLFCYLRLAFFAALLIVEAVCKSLQKREEKERLRGRKKKKENGVTFTSGRGKKLSRGIDGRKAGCLRCREGEKVKGKRVHCSTNYHSASRWRFPIICSPEGRRRSVVIVVDRYERGNILLRTFLWVSVAEL